MTRPCVYRAYNASGDLLYIGSTCDFTMRVGIHRRESLWIDQVAEWAVTEYHFLYAARFGEEVAIASEHPRWNIKGRSKHHPDGLLTRLVQVATLYPFQLRKPDYPDYRWHRDFAPLLAAA